MGEEQYVDEDILKMMGFTKEEIKKIKDLVDKGKTYKEAMAEVMKVRMSKAPVSKDPVKDVMAETMKEMKDIAIQKLGDKDMPILIVKSGGGEQQMDLRALLDFIGRHIESKEGKEVEELKRELKELKKLLAEREKAEKEEEIEMLDAKIDRKFAELKDELRRYTHPSPISTFDIGDFIKDLNEQGTLKDIINLMQNFVDMKKKEMSTRSKFQLLERAILIASNVKDRKEVDKIAKVLDVLSKIYGSESEGSYEIEEIDEGE